MEMTIRQTDRLDEESGTLEEWTDRQIRHSDIQVR